MTTLQDLRFLVVDDFPAMCRIVRGMLKEMGCEHCEEAGDGAVALSMLQASPFDFVISDVHMPEMDGFDLLKAIRADPKLKHLPVLLMSAQFHHEDLKQAYQSGASGSLTKPFTRATLEDRITRILQRLPSHP